MESLLLLFHLDKQRLIKDRFIQTTLKPLFTYLFSHHVSPNVLSGIGFLCHVASAYFFIDHHLLFVLFFLLFLLFDALDGTYARATGLASDTGGIVDRSLDFIGALLFYIKAYFYLPHTLVLVVAILYILNNIAMYAFRLEKKIGIFRWLCFAGLLTWYMAGLYLDIAYFVIFCPLRIAYHLIKRKENNTH